MKVRKQMRNISFKIVGKVVSTLAVFLLCVLVLGVGMRQEVFGVGDTSGGSTAAEGSAGNTTGSGGSVSCAAAGANRCNVDCTGFAWIYYSANEDAQKMEGGIGAFTAPGNTSVIDERCGSEGDGFWMLSKTAMATTGVNQDGSACGMDWENGYLNGGTNWVDPNRWGAMQSFTVGDANEMIKNGSSQMNTHIGQDNLGQSFSQDGHDIYRSTDVKTDLFDEKVVSEYYEACKRGSRGPDADCDSIQGTIPDDVSWFCKWKTDDDDECKDCPGECPCPEDPPEEEKPASECDEWAPDEYLNSNEWQGETKVRIGVKNISLEGWGGTSSNDQWHHTTGETKGLMDGPIYGKPTDKVQWKYCYYPGVERAANEKVTHESIDAPEPGEMHPNVNHEDNHLFKKYDGWNSEYYAWAEKFKTAGEYAADLAGYYGQAEPGDDTPLVGTLPGGPVKGGGLDAENRKYKIQPWEMQPTQILYANHSQIAQKLDPGDTLWGHIKTNDGYTHVDRQDNGLHRWQCNPYPCGNSICYETCMHDDNYYPNNRDKHAEQDDAKLIVPYNFKNRATATIVNADVLYSGETVQVENPRVTIGLRSNKETDGAERDGTGYATDVRDVGRARIVAFLMDGKTYESNPDSVWAGSVSDSDAYGNESDENGKIWQSTRDVCEPGANTAFNAKFNVCKFLDHYEGSLNENAALDGATYDFKSKQHYTSVAGSLGTTTETYNVFDEAAGNYFCVAGAVYPFSVKSDTDTDKDGDQSWYISTPSCVKIAKRPTFQVWGSGLYVAGDVNTLNSLKNNVLSPSAKRDTSDLGQMSAGGFEAWTPRGGTNVLFGSWGELAATIEGRTTTFNSGAGVGFRNGGFGVGWGGQTSPWNVSGDGTVASMGYASGFPGVENGTFCVRSPLTFGNLECSSGWAGGFSGGTTSVTKTRLVTDVEDLVKRFNAEDAAATGLYHFWNDAHIQPTVERGQTYVQVVDGDLTIGTNVIYSASASNGLSSLRDVGKYIIYASGNINISCNVNRIDAVVIAKGKVDTCPEGGDVNSAARSHQLVVNGAIVAGSLALNRTYGASTGEWSVTPAELINFDSSLYLWANSQAEAARSGQLTVSSGFRGGGSGSGTSEAAVRELAPRY